MQLIAVVRQNIMAIQSEESMQTEAPLTTEEFSKNMQKYLKEKES